MNGASATAGNRLPLIDREKLKEDYGLSAKQVEAWELAGLPVYGVGDKRYYDPAEVEEFIRSHPLERRKRATAE